MYKSPPAKAYGGELELPLHGTITDHKRPVDYPWNWVLQQLLNRKGGEIYYPLQAQLEELSVSGCFAGSRAQLSGATNGTTSITFKLSLRMRTSTLETLGREIR